MKQSPWQKQPIHTSKQQNPMPSASGSVSGSAQKKSRKRKREGGQQQMRYKQLTLFHPSSTSSSSQFPASGRSGGGGGPTSPNGAVLAAFLPLRPPATPTTERGTLHSLLSHPPHLPPHPARTDLRRSGNVVTHSGNATARFAQNQPLLLHMQYARASHHGMPSCARTHLARVLYVRAMQWRQEALHLPNWIEYGGGGGGEQQANYRLSGEYVCGMDIRGDMLAAANSGGVVRLLDMGRYLRYAPAERQEAARKLSHMARQSDDEEEEEEGGRGGVGHAMVTKTGCYDRLRFSTARGGGVVRIGSGRITCIKWIPENVGRLAISMTNSSQVHLYDVERQMDLTSASDRYGISRGEGGGGISEPPQQPTVSVTGRASSDVMDFAIQGENVFLCGGRDGTLSVIDAREPPQQSSKSTMRTQTENRSRQPVVPSRKKRPVKRGGMMVLGGSGGGGGGGSSSSSSSTIKRSSNNRGSIDGSRGNGGWNNAYRANNSNANHSKSSIRTVQWDDTLAYVGTENGRIGVYDLRMSQTRVMRSLHVGDMVKSLELELEPRLRLMSSHQIKRRHFNTSSSEYQNRTNAGESMSSFDEAVEIGDDQWFSEIYPGTSTNNPTSTERRTAMARAGSALTAPQVDSLLLHPGNYSLLAFQLSGGQCGLIDLMNDTVCKFYAPIPPLQTSTSDGWMVRRRTPCFLPPQFSGTFFVAPGTSRNDGVTLLDWSSREREIYKGQISRYGKEVYTSAGLDDLSMVVRASVSTVSSVVCMSVHSATGSVACGLVGEPILVMG